MILLIFKLSYSVTSNTCDFDSQIPRADLGSSAILECSLNRLKRVDSCSTQDVCSIMVLHIGDASFNTSHSKIIGRSFSMVLTLT